MKRKDLTIAKLKNRIKLLESVLNIHAKATIGKIYVTNDFITPDQSEETVAKT